LIKVPWSVNAALGPVAFGLTAVLLSGVSGENGDVHLLSLGALVFFWTFAGLSVVRNRQRRHLLDTKTSLASFKALPWKHFEFLVAETYRRKGYWVQCQEQLTLYRRLTRMVRYR